MVKIMTSPRHCFFCGVPLTKKTFSNEHIIPNSIGGRKKTQNFICKDCNNKFGETWDNELARQFNFFMILINGKRERGEIPKEKVNTLGGQEFYHEASGVLSPVKPILDIQQNNNKTIIKISARNEKELKSMLMGLRRRFPNINVDDYMQYAKLNTSYLNHDVLYKNFTLGGTECGRSFVKSCLALAASAEINDDYTLARQYLKNADTDTKNWNYYKNSCVINNEKFNIFHCVHVEAIPSKHMLIGYIEYFSSIRIIALLSDNYNGNEHSITYAIDPVTGKEIDANVSLPFKLEEVKNIIYSPFDTSIIKNGLNNFFYRAMEIAWNNELNNTIKYAFSKASKECNLKEGDLLTREILPKFSLIFAQEITNFITHAVMSRKQAEAIFPQRKNNHA